MKLKYSYTQPRPWEAHSRENKGTTIENKIETSDYKIIHHDEAPTVRNPLHGVEMKDVFEC